MNETLNIKTQEMVSLDQIISKIKKEINEYENKYICRPRFIKIPVIYDALLRARSFEVSFNFFEKDAAVKFCGLQLCPTYAIESIEEIEVF